MFEVSVGGWFAAAHQLRLLDGRWEPLHGHNWNVSVTFAGLELDAMGVLIDFVAVRRRLDEVLAALHDRNLNELAEFSGKNPSAEAVAVHVAERMAELAPAGGAVELWSVEVEETPGCVARFRPGKRGK